jgi:hypothetical protein
MSRQRAPALKSIDDLDEPLVRREQCRSLANARVVWANYDLIQSDFPGTDFDDLPLEGTPRQVKVHPGSDRPDIDKWLLHHAAIMSETQLQYTSTSEAISAIGPSRIGYRPPRYGRALVIQLNDTWPNRAFPNGGLLDVKGCGVAPGQVPQLREHRSGLLGLATAFCELATQYIVEKIFDHARVNDVRGVGVYAILDLGFRLRLTDGASVPAGAIIRRAHQRPPGNIERPDYGGEQHRIKLAIEFLLRRFGVTSCSPTMQFQIWREGEELHSLFRGGLDRIPMAVLERFLGRMSLQPPVMFDLVNVQLVRGATLSPLSATLVDFGQYDFIEKDFVHPLACLVEDRPLRWGGFIDRASPYWVQSEPEISVDGRLGQLMPTPPWVFAWSGAASPARTTGLFALAAELARDAAQGHVSHSELQDRILTFVANATRKLNNAQNGTMTSHSAWFSDALAHADGFLDQNRLRLQRLDASGH